MLAMATGGHIRFLPAALPNLSLQIIHEHESVFLQLGRIALGDDEIGRWQRLSLLRGWLEICRHAMIPAEAAPATKHCGGHVALVVLGQCARELFDVNVAPHLSAKGTKQDACASFYLNGCEAEKNEISAFLQKTLQ